MQKHRYNDTTHTLYKILKTAYLWIQMSAAFRAMTMTMMTIAR